MKSNLLSHIGLGLLLGLLCPQLHAQGFGEIRGQLKNTDHENVPFATVNILQGNLLIGGTQSDENGRYSYKPLNPGSYEVVVMDAGHVTKKINKVGVVPNDATYLDLILSPNTLTDVVVEAKAVDFTQTGADRNMYVMVSISGKDLNQMAGYVAGDIMNSVTSLRADVVQDQNGLHFRGSRGDASANYVDGVKLLGSANVPGPAVENLTIFSGGVPAMYGDMTGGMVMVTTKSYFSGIRDKIFRQEADQERREEEKQQAREH